MTAPERALLAEIADLTRHAEAACHAQNWPTMAFYLGVISGKADGYNAAPKWTLKGVGDEAKG